jgi:hypothetical protein
MGSSIGPRHASLIWLALLLSSLAGVARRGRPAADDLGNRFGGFKRRQARRRRSYKYLILHVFLFRSRAAIAGISACAK